MHQTNGGFVYVVLNYVRVKFLSDHNETTYGAYLIAFIKTNNYNKFDGIMQTKFSISDESPAGAECDWHQPTSITRISQSNCHINSNSGICVLINKRCFYR